MNNLAELLFEQEVRLGGRTAIIHGGRSASFAALASGVRRRSRLYREAGIGKGDRVLVFVPMGIELYEILLALFNIGASAVFLDAWASAERMNFALKLSGCRAFIGVPKAFLLMFRSRELRRVPVKFTSGARSSRPDGAAPADASGAAALITFTTGSTGVPKAALRTHDCLVEQHRVLREELELPPDGVDMATLPVFVLNNLASGVTTLIPGFDPRRPGMADGGKVIAEAVRHGVTSGAGSPAFFQRLADAVSAGCNPIPTMRKLFIGGAAVFPDYARRLLEVFPGCEIRAVYGSTEAEPISSLSFGELAGCRDVSGGLPAGLPNRRLEVAIIPFGVAISAVCTEDEWRNLILPSGVAGEICVSGPHVLRRYFRNREAEMLNKIRVGDRVFHRTGDAGRMDEAGRLFLLGRAAMVCRWDDGSPCYPFLVEAAMRGIDGISGGTVVKHPEYGAVLAVESRLSGDQLSGRLAQFNWSFRKLLTFKTLPRDPRHNSKFDYSGVAHLVDAALKGGKK